MNSDRVRGSGNGSDAISTNRPRNSGRRKIAWRQSQKPPRPGMLRSVTTTSKDPALSSSNPATPLAAVVTRQPRRVSERANASRIAALSSTIKTEYITELAMKDVGVLGYNECRSGVKGAQVLQGRSRLAQPSLGISAP